MMYGNVVFHTYLWMHVEADVFSEASFLLAPIGFWYGLSAMTIFTAGYLLNVHWQSKHELV